MSNRWRWRLGPEDLNFTALCPRCLKPVTNKTYFAGIKGSTHFRGTCKLKPWRKPDDFDKSIMIPHPSKAAWIGRINYRLVDNVPGMRAQASASYIKVMRKALDDKASFERFWGLT